MRSGPAIIILLLSSFALFPQSAPFFQNGRWGAKLNGKVVVPARYDTVTGFDQTGKVCLACYQKVQQTSSSQMRITSSVYRCNYLNAENRRLVIRNSEMDTTSVFYLGKNTVAQYTTSDTRMVVSIKGEKHVVDKDFTQLTFKGYHNIEFPADPNFYICEKENEWETIFTGVVNREEKIIVPFRYSSVKFNHRDSLIIACSAGVPHGTDDVYTLEGRKITASPRHIHLASRQYLVQKVFEPSEKYFLYVRENGTEKQLDADEVVLSPARGVLFRKKKAWYSYNVATGEKQPLKQPPNEEDQGSH